MNVIELPTAKGRQTDNDYIIIISSIVKIIYKYLDEYTFKKK